MANLRVPVIGYKFYLDEKNGLDILGFLEVLLPPYNIYTPISKEGMHGTATHVCKIYRQHINEMGIITRPYICTYLYIYIYFFKNTPTISRSQITTNPGQTT